jgi:hypothetical protein
MHTQKLKMDLCNLNEIIYTFAFVILFNYDEIVRRKMLTYIPFETGKNILGKTKKRNFHYEKKSYNKGFSS